MGNHPTLAHHQQTAEALKLDPDDWIHNHHPMAERTSEQAFDRLNPTFGVPADTDNPIGHNDIRAREAAFALGVRVAIHDQRQNDPNPVIWQAGQDYRMADALQWARAQPTRSRWGQSGSAPNAEPAQTRST
jgi:hypothetical protein